MAVAVLLTGCLGGGSGDDPSREAIAATIQRLERATARQDFAAICNNLLTPSARRRAGGPDCARLTRAAAADVRRPRLELKDVSLDGATAHVTVLTRAEGQAQLSERLVLRRERAGWRIDSLGD
jgi:ketosteroid isomerase-like protein